MSKVEEEMDQIYKDIKQDKYKVEEVSMKLKETVYNLRNNEFKTEEFF